MVMTNIKLCDFKSGSQNNTESMAVEIMKCISFLKSLHKNCVSDICLNYIYAIFIDQHA